MFSGFGDTLGKWMDNPLVQQGLEYGLGAITSNQANKSTQGAINQAGMAGKVDPLNVFSGFGNITQGEDGSLNFGGGVSDDLMGLGSSVLAGYNTDPSAAAAERYQMLTDLALPQENRMFNRLQNNLFKSGRSGTTGGLVTGDDSLRAFQESSNTADLQRQLAGQDWGRQVQQDIYNQGTGFMQNAFQPFAPLMNASIQGGAPNAAAGQIVNMQGGLANDRNQAIWGNVPEIGSAVFGKIGDWLNKPSYQQQVDQGYGPGYV